MSFKDKVVVITGASSGIGAATAVAYAKQGAKLVLGDRDEEKMKKTVKLCEEQGCREENLLLVLGDLTKEDVCNSLVDKTIEQFGTLDILVNNAGSTLVRNIDTCTIEDMDFMFNIHVRTVFMITKRAMPHLKKSKGNIVNISSVSAHVPNPNMLPYSTAKAAANQFTKCLAQDVGPCGVRLNIIEPGFIDTDIYTNPGGLLEGQPEKKHDFLVNAGKKRHALGRVGNATEVAEAILFLSSEAASFMTGAEVPVDGGLLGKNVF